MKFFTNIRSFLNEAKRRNLLLFNLSVYLSFLFLLFITTFFVCGNPPVSEICYWLKPFKFSLSFAVYIFTLGWLMEYLRPVIGEKRLKYLSRLITFFVVIEMTVIFLQSIRYSKSFSYLELSEKTAENISSTLHLIGDVAILMMSSLIIYIAIQFFRALPLKPSSYLLGIRAGFAIFISSCFLGLFLLLHYGQMPPDDESFGLPFIQANSVKDHLVSIHFFGIHALQLLPVMGFYFKEKIAYVVINFILFGYLASTLFFLIQAV